MLSTASAPSTSLATTFHARRRRCALWLRPVASAASASGIGYDGGAERFATTTSATAALSLAVPEEGEEVTGCQEGSCRRRWCFKKRLPWSLLQPFLHVDLVSTVHIADKEYFDRLQQELEDYDCVLYEMVTSRENSNNPKCPLAAKKMKSSRRGFNILGFIQKQMARILSLDYQLDCLDYGNEKWQHADLDYETFKQL